MSEIISKYQISELMIVLSIFIHKIIRKVKFCFVLVADKSLLVKNFQYPNRSNTYLQLEANSG